MNFHQPRTMRKSATALVLGCIAVQQFPAFGEAVEGRFGRALDAARGCAKAQPAPACSARPITVECWAKLRSKAAYNILIANEAKSSATHWELFTAPRTGCLSAYIPGFKPDHVQSQVDIADGAWHYVVFVLEDARARLFVDGVPRADVAVAPPTSAGLPGPMAVGALATGELRCDGLVDEVRLSNTAREIAGVPAAPFQSDAHTVGLWHFDDAPNGPCRDASPRGRDAVRVAAAADVTGETGIWPSVIPGGMPATFQPMPPPHDVADDRALLQQALLDLKLGAVSTERIRDGVLRDWVRQYETWRENIFARGQLEYPASRPGTWADPEKVREQAWDRHALVWNTDGGPLGTALRRTRALLDALGRTSAAPAIAPLARDLETVRAACGRTAPAKDTPAYRGFHLAVCALRRQAALANPLLDFDDILCVARGTFEGSARSNPLTNDIQGGHFVTQYFGFNALPGGGLFLVRNFKGDPQVVAILRDAVARNGRYQGRKLDRGAFATPDLSFDGREIVFAWTANREHKWVYSTDTCWQVFKVNADGSGLTQLTDGPNNHFDPCWLPSGRIAFISDRRGGYIRCFGNLPVRQYSSVITGRSNRSSSAPASRATPARGKGRRT